MRQVIHEKNSEKNILSNTHWKTSPDLEAKNWNAIKTSASRPGIDQNTCSL